MQTKSEVIMYYYTNCSVTLERSVTFGYDLDHAYLNIKAMYCAMLEPRQLSQYSDWATDCKTGDEFPAGEMIGFFLLATGSSLVLGPTQPSNQWVPGVKGSGRELTTHLHLVPRLRKCEVTRSLPHTSSWDGA